MTWLLLRQRLGTQHPGPARQPGLGLKVRGSGHTFSPVPAALLHPPGPAGESWTAGMLLRNACCGHAPLVSLEGLSLYLILAAPSPGIWLLWSS